MATRMLTDPRTALSVITVHQQTPPVISSLSFFKRNSLLMSSEIDNALDPHSLGGDCPFCRKSLAPYWKPELRHFYFCCGRSSCEKCFEDLGKSVEPDFDGMMQEFQQELHVQIQNQEKAGGVLNIESTIVESCKLGASHSYRHCPFCFTETHTNEANYTKELKTKLAQSAEKGLAWAQVLLGSAHLGCIEARVKIPGKSLILGGKKSVSRGVKLIQLAAKQNHPIALLSLAKMYNQGSRQCPKSTEKAKHFFVEAVNAGNPLAALELFSIFKAEKSIAQAYEYGEKASILGLAPASSMMGVAYEFGEDGQEKNLMKAIKYYKRGAEQGCEVSQFFAARLCKEVLHDEDQQDKYLKMSADQGYAAAECQLAMNYLDYQGSWIKGKTWPEGVRYLRRAASKGDQRALTALKSIETDYSELCYHCGSREKSKTFLRCSKCHAVHYCSKSCQKKAWVAGHRGACVPHDD